MGGEGNIMEPVNQLAVENFASREKDFKESLYIENVFAHKESGNELFI